MKSLSAMICMKVTKKYFPVMLFIVPFKGVVTVCVCG